MQQPTRLVQRNLRTALMLVDGKRSAGEIADQFSDGSIGMSALADLERAGMIRLVMAAETDEVQAAGMAESPLHPIGAATVSLRLKSLNSIPVLPRRSLKSLRLTMASIRRPSANPCSVRACESAAGLRTMHTHPQ